MSLKRYIADVVIDTLPIQISKTVVRVWRFFLRVFSGVQKPHTPSFNQSYYKEVSVCHQRFLLYLSPQNGFVDEYIHTHGTWDTSIAAVLKKYLQPGSVFVDVGSNIGFFSLFASYICKHVYAIEPLDFLREQCQNSIQKNERENITVLPYACSDTRTTLPMHIITRNVGGSTLIARNNDTDYTRTVSLRPMDELLHDTHVDVIKIDVEGFEPEVLRGAQTVITKNMPVIVLEFSPQLYEQKKAGDTQELVSYLQSLGYTLCDIFTGEALDITRTTRRLLVRESQCDLLCLPPQYNPAQAESNAMISDDGNIDTSYTPMRK